MADKRYARFQQKTDTTSNWNKATGFKPLEGEIIVYQDAGDTVPKIKIGHNNSLVSDLPFITENIEIDIDDLKGDVKQLAEDIETTNSRIDPVETKLSNTNIAYGTCSTAAATAEKIITIQTDAGTAPWELKKGAVIIVTFTQTNSASIPKFNVNNTGAKNVYYEGNSLESDYLTYAGYKNRPMIYVYDGTGYRFAGWGYDGNTNTYVKTYRQGSSSYNQNYPLIASKTALNSLKDAESSSDSVYGLVPTLDANVPTLNPYSGLVKVKSLQIDGDTPVMKATYDAKIKSIEDSIAAKTLVQIVTWEAND